MNYFEANRKRPKLLRMIDLHLRLNYRIYSFCMGLLLLLVFTLKEPASKVYLDALSKNQAHITIAYEKLDTTVAKLDTTIKVIHAQRYGDMVVMRSAMESLSKRDSIFNYKLNEQNNKFNNRLAFFAKVATNNKKRLDYLIKSLDSIPNSGAVQPVRPTMQERIILREWVQH